jgi:hypothetical protein
LTGTGLFEGVSPHKLYLLRRMLTSHLVGLARLKTGGLKLDDIDVISSTSVVCRYKIVHYDRGSDQRGYIVERKEMMKGCMIVHGSQP